MPTPLSFQVWEYGWNITGIRVWAYIQKPTPEAACFLLLLEAELLITSLESLCLHKFFVYTTSMKLLVCPTFCHSPDVLSPQCGFAVLLVPPHAKGFVNVSFSLSGIFPCSACTLLTVLYAKVLFVLLFPAPTINFCSLGNTFSSIQGWVEAMFLYQHLLMTDVDGLLVLWLLNFWTFCN